MFQRVDLEDELTYALEGLVRGLNRIVRVDKRANRLNFERSELVLDSVDALVVLPLVLYYDWALATIGHFLRLFHSLS